MHAGFSTPIDRRTVVLGGIAGFTAALGLRAPRADTPKPVVIALTGEFGLIGSVSAQAIEKGMRIAAEEVNHAGGVLGGRPILVVTADDRAMPARSIANIRKLAETPDLVAVFGGRFSPAVIECVPVVHELQIPLLLPWSAADGIIDNGCSPNYAFRLSLRDSYALPFMLRHALAMGQEDVGLLTPNTAWGRSSAEAAARYVEANSRPRLAGTEWFNWGDQSLVQKYQALRSAGARTIISITNEAEAIVLVREVAALPEEQRVPILSHWGVAGGKFVELVGPNLDLVDFSVVQTFSFFKADPPKVRQVLAGLDRLFGIKRIEDIEAPVGVAHAYDLVHILARAIDLAGSTQRPAIRDALEQVRDYDGLVKRFPRPFSPENHEALAPQDVFMARFAQDGTIRPVVRAS